MVQAPVIGRRQKLLVGVLFSAMVLSAFWQRQVADAQNPAATGSAYGFYANVSIFGGPANIAGPEPTVTLPADGGNDEASAPSAAAVFGPANIFTSGPLAVTTEGTTGASGSVTSTATIEDINRSGDEVFTADNLASTCAASESGVTGATAVTGGTLITSEGNPDVEGDETTIDIPNDPAPNTTYEGTIEAVNDTFRYVFNEQIENPDGSITVNAAHQYLLGPSGVGDLIIGQVVCGLNATDAGGQTTSTTGQPGGQVTTTTPARQGSTATTAAPSPPAPTTPAEPRFTG